MWRMTSTLVRSNDDNTSPLHLLGISLTLTGMPMDHLVIDGRILAKMTLSLLNFRTSYSSGVEISFARTATAQI